MMTALQIFEKLNSKNITVAVVGCHLKYKAPKGMMTDETTRLLRDHKKQLIEALRAKQTMPAIICYCCGGKSFWRKKNNQGGRWICSECHPTALTKDEIEWLQ